MTQDDATIIVDFTNNLLRLAGLDLNAEAEEVEGKVQVQVRGRDVPVLLAHNAEMLDALAIPAAVLSNKPQAATAWMVERLFARHRFQAVHGGRDDVPLKPDPAPLLAIVRELEVEPARTAYVGDTRTDMETAVAAGAIPVGVEWGFRDRDELVEHGARAVVATPAELLALLDGRRPA